MPSGSPTTRPTAVNRNRRRPRNATERHTTKVVCRSARTHFVPQTDKLAGARLSIWGTKWVVGQA
jgi:hypothetical protein